MPITMEGVCNDAKTANLKGYKPSDGRSSDRM